jgi:hypothetical protein
MSTIKIHLEDAELDPVLRLAKSLQVTAEDIAYTALNRLMLQANDPDLKAEITHVRGWHRDTLPAWSDFAGSIHAYESMPDEGQRPRIRLR